MANVLCKCSVVYTKHMMLEKNFGQILGKEAVYRLVIDEADVANVTEENCNSEMCSYTYYSNSLTTSSSVAVDIIGCVTERIIPARITARENIVSMIGIYLFIYPHKVCVLLPKTAFKSPNER